MFWIILVAFVIAVAGIWLGFKHLIYLDQINARNLSFTLLIVAFLFLILQWMHRSGWFPEAIAGAFMACMYALIFGFFTGMAFQQYQMKSKSGDILYINRTFLSDIFLNILAIALILFGIYRTSLLSVDIPFTPIRITSGLSLIAIGLYMFTIRPIPEFRKEGFILLDRKIIWDNFFSYIWFSENVIEIEYEQEDAIRAFRTMIPDEDHILIEKILSNKMKEKLEKDEVDEQEEI